MGNRVSEGLGKPGRILDQRGKTEGRRVREENAGSGATVRNGSPRLTPPPDRVPLPTCVKDLDALAPEYGATVRASLPIPLTDAEFDAIGDHVRLLLAWNSAINLSGIRDAEGIARQHVLDSLTAVPLLRRAGIDDFIDIGSGAGYPGIPLAIALPARRALLVESVAKKARFLAAAVAVAGVADRVGVMAGRAETLAADPAHRGHWGAVVVRAVADLTALGELALPLLRPGGLLVAWKRRPIDAEVSAAARAVRQLGGRVADLEVVSVPGLEDHLLVVVEKVAETPREFPRDPAARRRRPL